MDSRDDEMQRLRDERDNWMARAEHAELGNVIQIRQARQRAEMAEAERDALALERDSLEDILHRVLDLAYAWGIKVYNMRAPNATETNSDARPRQIEQVNRLEVCRVQLFHALNGTSDTDEQLSLFEIDETETP